jgi:hypothetical protein
MGIAWFDGGSVPMEAVELRSGGLPLLAEHDLWPTCPRCDAPLLFRAQIPLAMTSLVGPLDERTMSLFECHAETEGAHCDGTLALLASGERAPRQPPTPVAFDVLLEDAGPNAEQVAAVVARLGGDDFAQSRSGGDEDATRPTPTLAQQQTLARGIPATMAEQTLRILEESGARVVLRESPPTTLAAMAGAVLVPFDDGVPGASRTTLPPLAGLSASANGRRMRGFLGGSTPGNREHSVACVCGKPTRTVARLLGTPEGELALAPSVAQLCLSCGRAHYHRTGTR